MGGGRFRPKAVQPPSVGVYSWAGSRHFRLTESPPRAVAAAFTRRFQTVRTLSIGPWTSRSQFVSRCVTDPYVAMCEPGGRRLGDVSSRVSGNAVGRLDLARSDDSDFVDELFDKRIPATVARRVQGVIRLSTPRAPSAGSIIGGGRGDTDLLRTTRRPGPESSPTSRREIASITGSRGRDLRPRPQYSRHRRTRYPRSPVTHHRGSRLPPEWRSRQESTRTRDRPTTHRRPH
jgi:hypothetical protein